MLPFFKPDHLILRERTRRWVDEKGLSFSRHHAIWRNALSPWCASLALADFLSTRCLKNSAAFALQSRPATCAFCAKSWRAAMR